MTRRQRLRLRADQRRQRWFAGALRSCHSWPSSLHWLRGVAIAAVNALNVLWIAAIAALYPVTGSPRLRGPIEHIFVLVLENRSFDHMLGYSLMQQDAAGKWQPARGVDAVTGEPTLIDGPDATRDRIGECSFLPGAVPVMPDDPPHEFDSIRTQLCGPKGTYPRVTMDGFIDSYRTIQPHDPCLVMKGFSSDQVPVISALAREFAVCDRWFSALPGPTWPNRFFWHAASSAGLDASPSFGRTVSAATFVNGFAFSNGTIYDALSDQGFEWAIYHGDAFPQALAIAGMEAHLAGGHFHPLDEFAEDVKRPDFAPSYVFLEPSYGHTFPQETFAGGSSQHPVDDVAGGERLIKQVYEAIRASPHWERSLLIISYDEHGGFYDHVRPPGAVAPGDVIVDPTTNNFGFDFSLLGVRVPAIVVSPLVPRGSVDHLIHDHTSALATVENLFGLSALTGRDRAAIDLTHLISLTTPRQDTPETLPEALTPQLPAPREGIAEQPVSPTTEGFLQIALRRRLQVRPPEESEAVIDSFASITTQGQAIGYMQSAADEVSRRNDAAT